MCGIVGYIGPRAATPIIVAGLRRLEYRGYDSAGLATLTEDGQVEIRRDTGKLSNLERLLAEQPAAGHIGIGHTRWATHGKPTPHNAHPHVDCTGKVVLIHNGIVENFLPLREELLDQGHEFGSETDSEVIVHLVEQSIDDGCILQEAVRRALLRIQGSHAVVVMSALEPDKLVIARLGNAGGVTVGLGEGETFVASDLPAILEHTRRAVFLESRQMAVVTVHGARYFWVDDGREVQKSAQVIPWDPVSAEKGPYKHFMQKEIYEQARSLTDTIRGRVNLASGVGEVVLSDLNLTTDTIQNLQRVVIVACGTAAYAGLVGKFLIEGLARLPTEVDYGSEFRYRDPLLNEQTLVIAVTQSGETADTLAAMEEALSKQAHVISIVNAYGSQAQRMAEGHIMIQAGPEIGVASTKAFTGMLVDLYLLAIHLGTVRQVLGSERRQTLLHDLALLPDLVGRVLAKTDHFDHLAVQFQHAEHFLYLGRGINYPIALEGALKLKEISYIHAEGYPAGEMKHGPIALIDERMPVVAICLRDSIYDKMVSQVEQVKARGGIVLALATEGDEEIARKADYTLYLPPIPPLLEPVVAVIPMQLLAYHLAVRRGCDVDQPRNLAKSVTVE